MEKNKLSFFSDKNFLNKGEEYVPLLYPFWGYYPEPKDYVDKNRFLELYKNGKKYFTPVKDIKKSDIIVSPIAYEKARGKESAQYFSNIAKKYNKKVIIFFNSDSTEDIAIDNAIVFRTSFYKSTCKKNEFALPGWSTDFIEKYYKNKIIIREKKNTPIVGYCGYIDFKDFHDRFIYTIKYLLGKAPKKLHCQHLRGSAVRIIKKNKNIQTNFIIRNGFMGEKKTIDTRKEYFDNIIDSDYCLVARGGGNFSYRLYEVLSCGRIPVFINTDCVLPFDDFIDWKKYCVWVEEKELKNIDKKVLDFHKNISNKDFKKLQADIRALYEEWISPLGFHKNIWRYYK